MSQFPGDPEISDKVINAMLSTESMDSETYAKIANLDHEIVKDCLRLLESYYPNHFQGAKGYGNNISLFIRPTSVPLFKTHQLQGGFSSDALAQEHRDREDKVKEDLELEKLRLEVELYREQAFVGVRRAEKRAKRSEIIAWLALLITVAAMLLDYFKE